MVEVGDDTEAVAADTAVDAALARGRGPAVAAPAHALAPATVAVDATARPDHREAGRRGRQEVTPAPVPVRVAVLVQKMDTMAILVDAEDVKRHLNVRSKKLSYLRFDADYLISIPCCIY